MKIKTVIGITVLAAFSLFAIGSFAQRSSAQTDTNNSNTSSSTYGYMGPGGMMSGGMMQGYAMNGRMMYGNRMGRTMMGNYTGTQKLINRLESDLSAAKAQAGSAALKKKHDDASSLLSRLREDFSNSWGMVMHYMPMHGDSYCYWNQTGQQQTQQQKQ